MQASTADSVLIEQVAYLASRARQATNQDPIFDLPKGKPGVNACPIARALNLNCLVHSATITFQTSQIAAKVAEAVGAEWNQGKSINLSANHPFARFVRRFDSGSASKHLMALRTA